MSHTPYPVGIDCIWVARDSNGGVAAFVTAGLGPIPIEALDEAQIDIREVEDIVMQLPIIAHARLLVVVARPDDFQDLSKRGLYVYDWSDAHRAKRDETGKYELVAIPSIPLSAKFLPSCISSVSLEGVRFCDEMALNVSYHAPCIGT